MGPSTETTITTKGSEITRTDKVIGAKTFWDWISILFIPVVIGGATYWFRQTEREVEQQRAEERAKAEQQRAEERAKAEQTIAEANRQEAALQAYLDHLTELLLEEDLRTSKLGSEVRSVARARTMTALRVVGGVRVNIILQVLRESGLLIGNDEAAAIIDLREIDLSALSLPDIALREVNLEKAHLEGAILKRANLVKAILTWAGSCVASVHGVLLQ